MGLLIPQGRPFFLQVILSRNSEPECYAWIVIDSLSIGRNSSFTQRRLCRLPERKPSSSFLKGSHFSRNREAFNCPDLDFTPRGWNQKWTLTSDLLSAHCVTLGSPSPHSHSEWKQFKVRWSSLLDWWWENVSEQVRADSGTREMTVPVSCAHVGLFLCRLWVISVSICFSVWTQRAWLPSLEKPELVLDCLEKPHSTIFLWLKRPRINDYNE